MKRREFILLIGGAAATWPGVGRAQQTKLARIAVLAVGGVEPIGPFAQELRELGYVEGTNIQIEVRSAQGQISRLPELAAEIARSPTDVIVAVQTPAAHAAKNATRDIPIVMMAGDPIATGLVSNLARPDGNLTGISATAAEAAAKSLELINEVVPETRRVGVLGNANDPFVEPFLEQIRRGALLLRLEVHQIIIHGKDDLESAFAEIARGRANAIIIQGSLPEKLSADFAHKYRLPSVSTQKSAVEAGMLMSYTASFAERARVIASYVDKILKGAKPVDLPVQQPTRYEIVVNLKTAKAMGLAMPPSLLARADEVIE
jgi:putative tryptophan/tyrosine transport system substrate-binding protein